MRSQCGARLVVMAAAATIAWGQTGAVGFSGSIRTRVEAWDWFQGDADSRHAYSGSLVRAGWTGEGKRFDWQAEFALAVLAGLPTGATAGGAQGQLGFGATYAAANDGNANSALPFLKQGYVRLKGFAAGHWLKAGRMEFGEGAETTPANPSLAALKRDRIAQRLLGNFGFTHANRSFDGVLYAVDRGDNNVTLLAARPTRGVFQVDGWGELNINAYYGALTREAPRKRNPSEWRLFGIGYHDYRGGVLKSDNRAPGARAADQSGIQLATGGGHYLQLVETRAGAVDLLLWGAMQFGSWGALRHRAFAGAVEAGWQPAAMGRIRPWFRGGYNHGSGDGDADDGTHGTFFLLLPTPRGYARFPFYNMMNTRELFGEAVFRPSRSMAVRTDVHWLRLARREDLWYIGGGAFQPWTFGFPGRPSQGNSRLARLVDASLDYSINSRISAAAYYGHAAGGPVAESVYPRGKRANPGLVELTYRF